jgi:DNA-directed RNA polymerase beta subunit
MPRVVIKCQQNLDETGKLEEFTNDLSPLMPWNEISHLASFGLAKIGTDVYPGMVLIGKLGGKKLDANFKKLSEVERILFLPGGEGDPDYWRKVIYDSSVRAPEECVGRVVDSYFELKGKRLSLDFEPPPADSIAVVEIETKG